MNATKNFWLLFIVLISGLVIGGFIGNILEDVSFLSWLNYSKTVGLTSPLIINLEIIQVNFGITIRFSLCGIIGMISAMLIYKKFSWQTLFQIYNKNR